MRVAALARKHDKKTFCEVRLPGLNKDVTEEDKDQVKADIAWALDTEGIDGVVLYEGATFTVMNPKTGETTGSPAMSEIIGRFGAER